MQNRKQYNTKNSGLTFIKQNLIFRFKSCIKKVDKQEKYNKQLIVDAVEPSQHRSFAFGFHKKGLAFSPAIITQTIWQTKLTDIEASMKGVSHLWYCMLHDLLNVCFVLQRNPILNIFQMSEAKIKYILCFTLNCIGSLFLDTTLNNLGLNSGQACKTEKNI